MMQVAQGFVRLLLAALASGCSFGSFQTAHTQTPGTVSVTPGATYVFNRIDDEAGRGLATNVGAQLGGRVGITDRFDAGIGGFMRSGLKVDAKVNVLEPSAKLAVAPRLGAGYRIGRKIGLVEGGGIASYRFASWFEPYLGLSLANHWIEAEAPPFEIGPHALGKSGTGDGVLQMNLGVELALSKHVALLAEYGRWFPLYDDPGDYYDFLPTNVAGVALRIGRVRR
jgi:hypothetical protein